MLVPQAWSNRPEWVVTRRWGGEMLWLARLDLKGVVGTLPLLRWIGCTNTKLTRRSLCWFSLGLQHCWVCKFKHMFIYLEKCAKNWIFSAHLGSWSGSKTIRMFEINCEMSQFWPFIHLEGFPKYQENFFAFWLFPIVAKSGATLHCFLLKRYLQIAFDCSAHEGRLSSA